MIQKAVGFFVVFLLFPICMGFLWKPGMDSAAVPEKEASGADKKKYRIDQIYLAGFLTELALFQLIAVPVMIAKARGMSLLVVIMNVAGAALSMAGVMAAWRGCKKARRTTLSVFFSEIRAALSSLSWECRLFWLFCFGAILFQMYMAFAYASFDGDDAYYVVQSVLADQTNVLNRIKPYTGLSTELDIRHALAALPLWEAYVARMTGIHAAIVAHTLLPLVLIPLTYLAYFEVGKKLFSADDVKLPIFLTLVSIMQIWGNSSIYTNATFFLTRTWQGKSILANLVLIVLIWLLLEIFERQEGAEAFQKRDKSDAAASASGPVAVQRCSALWGLLIVNNIVAAMMTSMGAFLAAMFIGIAAVVAAVRYKKPGLVVKLGLCCIPNAVYLVLLLIL